MSEGTTRPSQGPTHPVPRLDKGKQPADDQQQRKRKRATEANDDELIEVREGNIMTDAWHIELRDGYVNIN